MATISIKCPHCGVDTLQIDPAKRLNIARKPEECKVTCAKCQTSLPLGKFIPKYCLKVDNQNYQLHFGSQWVGRKSDDSKAAVQIPDNTNYMSRKHAIIELRCTDSGIECTFEEHGKNPTKKDGIELIEGDIVYLNINDCLELGGRRMYLANEFE